MNFGRHHAPDLHEKSEYRILPSATMDEPAKTDNSGMTDARIVLTTLNDLEQANHLANALVEARLAACVNLIDHIHSVYRWQGKTEATQEILLIIKTSVKRLPALKEAILELHPYELPELLVVPIIDGSQPYLAWLLDASQGRRA